MLVHHVDRLGSAVDDDADRHHRLARPRAREESASYLPEVLDADPWDIFDVGTGFVASSATDAERSGHCRKF